MENTLRRRLSRLGFGILRKSFKPQRPPLSAGVVICNSHNYFLVRPPLRTSRPHPKVLPALSPPLSQSSSTSAPPSPPQARFLRGCSHESIRRPLCFMLRALPEKFCVVSRPRLAWSMLRRPDRLLWPLSVC